MFNYSNATVEGFITRNPDSRTTKTGKTVSTTSLAINNYSKADEPPRVSFLDVEAWEDIALELEQIEKGKKVMVIGNLKQDRWEDENGKVNSRLKIIANEIRVLK